MHLLNLDNEQAEMLLDAADTATRFLRYRSARVDPEGLLSAAAELQERKLQHVRLQLQRPLAGAYSEMAPAMQSLAIAAARSFAAADSDEVRDIAWKKLVGVMLSARPLAIEPGEETPDET